MKISLHVHASAWRLVRKTDCLCSGYRVRATRETDDELPIEQLIQHVSELTELARQRVVDAERIKDERKIQTHAYAKRETGDELPIEQLIEQVSELTESRRQRVVDAKLLLTGPTHLDGFAYYARFNRHESCAAMCRFFYGASVGHRNVNR